MGVLEPLERNAEEAQKYKGKWFNRLESVVSELPNYRRQIINNELDKLAEHAPDFYNTYPDEELEDMETEEDVLEEAKSIEKLKDEISLDAVKAKYAQKFVEENDVEINYEDPINTYKMLDNLQKSIETLDERIQQAIIDKFDINEEVLDNGYTENDYENRTSVYGASDDVEAFFLQEALHEINENINREKENLLSKAVDEHRENSQEYVDENDLNPFPEDPVDWEDEIDEDCLADFLDVSELAEGTAGLTLHKMMEEAVCPGIEGLEPEYRLDFLNKGGRFDTPVYNVDGDKIRIDNTIVPDAIDDLFVYDFKHMPQKQKDSLEKNGVLESDERFLENVNQLNKYLNALDLPAGMLVYISSDIELEEFVLEQHDGRIDEESLDSIFHKKEDYDFSTVPSKI